MVCCGVEAPSGAVGGRAYTWLFFVKVGLAIPVAVLAVDVATGFPMSMGSPRRARAAFLTYSSESSSESMSVPESSPILASLALCWKGCATLTVTSACSSGSPLSGAERSLGTTLRFRFAATTRRTITRMRRRRRRRPPPPPTATSRMNGRSLFFFLKGGGGGAGGGGDGGRGGGDEGGGGGGGSSWLTIANWTAAMPEPLSTGTDTESVFADTEVLSCCEDETVEFQNAEPPACDA